MLALKGFITITPHKGNVVIQSFQVSIINSGHEQKSKPNGWFAE